MKALIHDDKVVDVKEQSYEVHPSMKWIDCPNDIRIGFFYDGKTFKSDEQTPEEIIKIRMIQLREIRDSLLTKLIGQLYQIMIYLGWKKESGENIENN